MVHHQNMGDFKIDRASTDRHGMNPFNFGFFDLTDLDYAEVELILDNSRTAPLCNIQIYCKAMKLDMFEFIGKALA